jgi:F-type H+-transporting ATPase subunit a
MSVTPDDVVLWEWGFVRLTATIVFTWVVMAVLVGASWLVTRRFTPDRRISRGQNLLEVIVLAIRDQIRGVGVDAPQRYLPFVGTLFLFVAVANSLAVIPGYQAPTGSLSTTTALALTVFVAVPAYGVRRQGLMAYLRQYARPTVLMLPFNIIGEFSRTLALAVRLFGNVMSAALIGAVLLGLAPLFFPVVLQLFGLLTGLIQAYIFAILAIVYIASGMRVQETTDRRKHVASDRGAERGADDGAHLGTEQGA